MRRSPVDVAVDIAREAGVLLAEAFVAGVEAEAKGRFDIVTTADRAAEALILRRLRDAFPSHGIVAEESGRHRGTSGCRWYVDPLDGTKNFARGNPSFAVSLAWEDDERLLVGVVFDPMRRELFVAEHGGGAWCNERRIRVSPTDALARCLVATGFPSAARHAAGGLAMLDRLCMSTHGLRRTGSSALDLSYVACGRVDAFWDIGLHRWDVAAAVLLVTESGGYCSDLQGGPVGSPADVVAANTTVHQQLIELCRGALV
jgi:myo-inositol-1(or 4)-monophosphatase